MKKSKLLRLLDGVFSIACIVFVGKLAELATPTYDHVILLISGGACFFSLREYCVLRCYREFERKGLIPKKSEEDCHCDRE